MTIQCYFLDVGQGTSQVILLGNQRAIVVDTGPSHKNKARNVCFKLLQKQQIQWIEALVLSHDHIDHTGGISDILQEYRTRIRRIFYSFNNNNDFIQDFQKITHPLLTDASSSKTLCKRLLKPCLLYDDNKTKVELLYPSTEDQNNANVIGDINYTSGVVLLTHQNHSILFTADAPYSAFEQINTNNGLLDVDIATISHHGGNIDATPNQLNKLFSNYLKTKFAIVSVGTRNSYNHPNPNIIRTIANHDIGLFCTQITSACCPEESLEIWRNIRGDFGLDNSLSTFQRDIIVDNNQELSRNVACAGTIIATISENGTIIEQLDDLYSTKEKLKNQIPNSSPCCNASCNCE